MAPRSHTEIFICFADDDLWSEDDRMRHELELRLNASKKLGFIRTWSSRNVSPGQLVEHEIDSHLHSADVILLLLSPSFFSSERCLTEASRALELHTRAEVRVIPILVRPVAWGKTPFAQFQALPSNGRAITAWEHEEDAFQDVINGITKGILARKPIEIFYCYARKDQMLRKDLDQHLASLKRTGKIVSWYDREILGGVEWKQEIDRHLKTADIILLLVSHHFLASDYCYHVEMQQALERQKSKNAHVIPIILSPVSWQDTPLGALQALPRDGKPITTWSNRNEALVDVEQGIRRVLEEFFNLKV